MKNQTRFKTASESVGSASEIKIQQLFKLMVDKKSSDLHISVGSPPGLRVHDKIIRVKTENLTPADSKRLVYQILTEEQKHKFEKEQELDISFSIKGLARFRGNVFYAQGAVSGVFRLIPTLIPDFKILGLPSVILEMTDIKNGLILVTGPTGSGKSTTLASIIDRLNTNESSHIITLEDPIEFVHPHKSCLVNQREVGNDSNSFHRAIKSLLRQDPDIVLIGELRDAETIEAALTIAETGHLVFGTLHTNSAVQTINRIINVFPPDEQDQIRTLISFVLKGVVSQQLVPKSFETGRVCVVELMRTTPAIKNLIRENKIHQLYSQMQTGQHQTGMITMNQSLKRFLDSGVINADTAMSFSPDPEEMSREIGRSGKKTARG